MLPEEELLDLLARVVGKLDEDLLADDPELVGMVSQLIQILEPKAQPLPLNITEQLTGIENRMERFKRAAELLQAQDPETLKQLAESMRASGLLKAEHSTPIERAKKADLVRLPEKVKGTNCANCKFVDLAKDYCNHSEVDQSLPDGASRMCCAFWDAKGTHRAWED